MLLSSLRSGLLAAALTLSLVLPASAQMYKPKPKAKPAAVPTDSTGAPIPGARPAGSVVQLSTDPVVFAETDVVKLLGGGKSAKGAEVAQQFQGTWSGGRFSGPQQARIIGLAQQMVGRRYKAHPHYEQFFGSLVSAVNEQALSGSALDDLLTVFEKTLANDPPVAMPKLLATVAQILTDRTLFKGRTSSLQFAGGKFAFQYYDDKNLPPEFGKLLEPAKPEVKEEPKKEEPKPEPKPVAKKAKPKPKPKPKPANDGWGNGWGDEPAAAKADDGWGSSSDDGWGAPKPKPKPKPKPAAPKPAPEPKPADDWGSDAPKLETAKADDGFGWSGDAFDKPNPMADMKSGLIPYTPEPMPPITGAALVLKDVDLVLGSTADSLGAVIRKTTGALMLTKGQFVGAGGSVQWEPKPGQPATATLKQFMMDVSKPGFKAEGATLEYAAVLEKPIEGVLDYKAVRRSKAGVSTYPRFASFTNDARIKNLGDGISYKGGFALAGPRISTSALDGSISALRISYLDTLRMRAESHAFQLGDSLITAARAAISLRQRGNDSLTHPGVRFKYGTSKHKLTLVRGDGVYKMTPYFDSYHQMEIGAELVTWDIRSPYINFAMITAKNQVFARFDSKEYYTDTYYKQQKTIARFHPLQLVYAYGLEMKVDQFFLIELAEARQLPQQTLHKAMMGLARDGFVDYNGMTGQVTLKPKVKHYVLSAKGKKDYDHISVLSLSSAGKNATLDLQTSEILVRGVERFAFSPDTVDVYAQPDSGIVHIQKNRNMKFDGRVVANAMTFIGREFQFDYDGFYVDLTKLDSTVVRDPKKKDSEGRPARMVLTSRGGESGGRLFLNRPDNKSGRKRLGKYPSFKSNSGTYVYFNDPAIQGGVYDTTVYFEVPPFQLDSLNGTAKAPVGLKGIFRSGGIFPDIETSLSLMADGSSGFVYKVPPGGIQAYGGKGTLFNTIKMDNGGLQGVGELKVKDAKLKSDQIVFYVDSAVAVGQTVSMASSSLSPKLEGKDYLMKWFAQKDSLTMTTQAAPFKVYDKGDYTFAGTMIVTPKGTGGSGTLSHTSSLLSSPDMTFKPQSYDGRHALFQIKTAGDTAITKPALKAKDANVHYDIAGGYAEFAPEKEGAATVELTGVQYRTSLPGGRWDFKQKRVTMKTPEGNGLAKSYFVSTKPDQQGLRFPAQAGSYDLQKLELRATGVPYITVGDARIQPDSMRVIVHENAQMDPFQKAVITMDTVTKFHRLYDGQIQIASRNRFTGSASYRYVNRGDTATIKFNDFRIDSASVLLRAKDKDLALNDAVANPNFGTETPAEGVSPEMDQANAKARAKALKEKEKADKKAAKVLQQKKEAAMATGQVLDAAAINGLVTRARALVGDKEQVFVAPRIQYRGGMAIVSRRRGFTNEGEGRLRLSAQQTASDWFPLKDSIDPANVLIPIAGLKAPDGNPLVTGIMRSDETGKLYPLYMGVKQNAADLSVLEVGGELTYDKTRDVFGMGNSKRDNFEIIEGNTMAWAGKNGGVTFRGTMRFINDNKNFNIEASGIGTGVPDSNQYEVNAMMIIDMAIPPKALNEMGPNIIKSSEGAPRAVELPNDDLISKVGDLVGTKAAKAFNNVKPGALPDPMPRFNPKFNKALVINEVHMKWSRKNRAWYSTGLISVSNVLSSNVNYQVPGYIEIKRAPEGDLVEILLEPDPSTFYHIKYANNTILTWSSWEPYANEVQKNQPKTDYATALQFGVWAGDEFQKDQFRGWFLKQYRSEEERRKLKKKGSSAPPPPKTDTFQSDGAADDTAKKKKKDDAAGDGGAAPANSNFSPNPTDAPTDADTGKKKKKKDKEAEATPTDAPAAEPANPNFSDDGATDDGGKKKKKDKESDAFGEPTSPQ